MLVFSSAYSEYTVISKEYTGPLDFDITGVYCILFILILLVNLYFGSFSLEYCSVNRLLVYTRLYQ